MADILPKEHKQKAGVRRSKKSSLRVDLTPMVDLGFLLISFFIFTNTLSHPTVMKLAMPDDRDMTDPSEAPEGKTLNLVLGANDNVYAYDGSQLKEIKDIGRNATAVRAVILQKKNEIKHHYGSDSGMIVLIKPTPASSYGNIINALDEMVICDVNTYVLMDANNDEAGAVK